MYSYSKQTKIGLISTIKSRSSENRAASVDTKRTCAALPYGSPVIGLKPLAPADDKLHSICLQCTLYVCIDFARINNVLANRTRYKIRITHFQYYVGLFSVNPSFNDHQYTSLAFIVHH